MVRTSASEVASPPSGSSSVPGWWTPSTSPSLRFFSDVASISSAAWISVALGFRCTEHVASEAATHVVLDRATR